MPSQNNATSAWPLDDMRLVKDAQRTRHHATRCRRSAHKPHMSAPCKPALACCALDKMHANTIWKQNSCTSFRQHGSQFPAYTSIVAAGANACVLHYRADTAQLRDGDLVLIDAGCELDGYAIRHHPHLPRQRAYSAAPKKSFYNLVLASQDAAVAATKAGARFTDPHDATAARAVARLVGLGLVVKPNKHGSVDDVIANKRAYFSFYMHRTSHWLGMDVHDCGSYIEPSEAGTYQHKTRPALRRNHHATDQVESCTQAWC